MYRDTALIYGNAIRSQKEDIKRKIKRFTYVASTSHARRTHIPNNHRPKRNVTYRLSTSAHPEQKSTKRKTQIVIHSLNIFLC